MQQRRPPIKPPPPPLLPSPKQSQRLRLVYISMAALLSSTLLSLLLFFTISSASRHRHRHRNRNPTTDTASSIIHEVCKASRDPSTCLASLTHVPPDATVLLAIQSAIQVSAQNLNSGRGMVQDILDASASNLNRSTAAKTCLELLNYSDCRTKLVTDALPRGRIKDARAWMSAALVYQYDCWSALKYVNDTSLVDKTMAFFNSSLISSTSSALGMMVNYDNFGEKTGSWGPPKTERDGFWESGQPRPDPGQGSASRRD